MNKITTNTTCACCDTDTILKIVAGNDFSLRITLTYKEDDVTQQYDLSNVEDLDVYVVSPTGQRIHTDSHIDEYSRITAVIDAQRFDTYTPYDLEVVWRDEPYDKRALAPHLLTFVNSSREANDAQEVITDGPYDYNLEILSDIALVTIGEMPDIYITQQELDDTLTSYVTNSTLDTTLSSYINKDTLDTTLDAYATIQYVDDALSNIDLQDYYTKSDIDTTLSSYGRSLYGKGWKITSNLDYMLSYQVQLKNDDNVVSEVWIPAHNKKKNTDNEWDTSFWSGLIRRDDYLSMINGLDTLSTIQSDYINNDTLNTTLSSYVKDSELTPIQNDITSLDGRVTTLENNPAVPSNVVTCDDATYIYMLTQSEYDTLEQGGQLDAETFYYITDTTNNYLKRADADTLLLSYVKQADLDTTLTSYVKQDDLDTTLSSYVKNSDLDVTLTSYVKDTELTTALTPIQNDISSLDGRVTTLEQSGGLSGVSEEDWDNSNEAIAYELTNNRLEHQTFSNNFSYYYTKTEADGRYATQSWANGKFVTQADDLNRQQAIAAAFGASVQSTTVHNIWTGSQNDYDAITTKDTNTLYVIL